MTFWATTSQCQYVAITNLGASAKFHTHYCQRACFETALPAIVSAHSITMLMMPPWTSLLHYPLSVLLIQLLPSSLHDQQLTMHMLHVAAGSLATLALPEASHGCYAASCITGWLGTACLLPIRSCPCHTYKIAFQAQAVRDFIACFLAEDVICNVENGQ